ncbi:Pc13g06890 [Penicillium rubens Wisconsin 54-1255]|uniref:Pc13g06890 protein n=1 Tax=Penicillium rubens (strain ATCC 28089 / DSM 1075 / NRRL 1951 / Wisconsin 54-1255) TaxID=500485 RepID=B6H3N0_PENRW|nr:Pc13g06890 [Penicillium rubens Wisconsin 54-1255]
MTEFKTDDSKAPSYTVDSVDLDDAEKQEVKHQVPLLDSELQRPQAKDIIHTLAKALNDIADEKKCTKCTAENISTLITGHVRDLRAAKRSGMWSKEDKKALKVEIKGLLKPAKKDIKSLWKANY